MPHAVQCLKAGKHVFIEKPMAITLGGADEIEAARKESGNLVFVGYMRRYAEAFLRVKEMVQDLQKGSINYVRVRDIIGYVRAGLRGICGACGRARLIQSRTSSSWTRAGTSPSSSQVRMALLYAGQRALLS